MNNDNITSLWNNVWQHSRSGRCLCLVERRSCWGWGGVAGRWGGCLAGCGGGSGRLIMRLLRALSITSIQLKKSYSNSKSLMTTASNSVKDSDSRPMSIRFLQHFLLNAHIARTENAQITRAVLPIVTWIQGSS